jgi:DNA-binding transcriptional ArsR family regulator
MIGYVNRAAFKLLEDETRRRIVFMLRDEVLTVKEISNRLDLTPQNIYHHMNKLEDEELVKLSYERRDGHIIESYYTTTADTFIHTDDRIEQRPVQSYIDVLNGLNELGLDLEVNMKNALALSKFHDRYVHSIKNPHEEMNICDLCSFSGFFVKYGPLNPVLLNRVFMYAGLLEMDDSAFNEYLDRIREIRYFLQSIKK